MPEIFLLGPQRDRPTLAPLLEQMQITGPVAVITAGWQEREGETEELGRHLGQHLTDLEIYLRLERVFERDPELFEAHRRRQDRLKQLQRLYRLRLFHAMETVRSLWERREEPEILLPEQRAAVSAVRAIDRHHLERMSRIHRKFEEEMMPIFRPSLKSQQDALAGIINHCDAVLIAGGHVVILLNRMKLLGLGSLLSSKPVFAWSAGAMALSERIVLFHDRPPQGAGDAEVVEVGLGLAPRVTPLPHAAKRLNLNDKRRVALLASRFRPSLCAALDEGAILRWSDPEWTNHSRALLLSRDGRVCPFETA